MQPMEKGEFQPERESLLDTAKIMYSKKLWGGELSIKTGITGSAATVVPLADSQTKEEEGWALRTTKKAKAFSEKQRKFLEEKFMVGETTGRKRTRSCDSGKTNEDRSRC